MKQADVTMIKIKETYFMPVFKPKLNLMLLIGNQLFFFIINCNNYFRHSLRLFNVRLLTYVETSLL